MENTKSDQRGLLDARSATIIFFSYVGAQLFCGFVSAMVAFAIAAARGINNEKQINIIFNAIDVNMMVPTLLIAGTVMVLMSYKLAANYIRDITPNGGAWHLGTWKAILMTAGFGVIIGVCPHLLQLHRSHSSLGEVSRMALTPGFPRLVFIVTGVLLTPVIEEMLFRGVLYGGYRKSFGPAWAITLTTFLFVLLHIPEYMHSLPGILLTIVGALVALWCRLRFSAIGPAVAFHAGFNAAQVLMLFVRL